MISEQAVQIMEEYADDAAKMLAMFREMGRERGELEGFESSWRALIEVARLLNSDARLRDALGEARDRAANRTLCAECGEPSSAAINGKPLCGACYDAANAANLITLEPPLSADAIASVYRIVDGPVLPEMRTQFEHEPDLAPSDAQDDSGEVTP